MIVLRIGKLAKQLGVHRNTIRNWIRSGKLPARSVPGKRYLLSEEDFIGLCQSFGLDPDSVDVRRIPEKGVDRRPIDSPEREGKRLHQDGRALVVSPGLGDACFNCGACAAACPLSRVDGFDPRTVVRMAVLGLDAELVDAAWPWKCTLCGRCEEACPMDVEIVELVRRARALRDRAKVPGSLQRGVEMHLCHGNNLGIPSEDFEAWCTHLCRELNPGGESIDSCPVDRRGARLLVLINSLEPFARPEDMEKRWLVLQEAGESWTFPSHGWEGACWAYFTGDDPALKKIAASVLYQAKRLKCQAVLLPDLGHGYYALAWAMKRWFSAELGGLRLLTHLDLLRSYLLDGRIRVDPSQHAQRTTYHDPCYFGRRSRRGLGKDYFDQARDILEACCPDFVEMVPTREHTYCCGAGGGSWGLPFSCERVFHGESKAQQIQRSGARLVVTACPACRDQIESTLCREFGLDVKVKTLWGLIADAMVG